MKTNVFDCLPNELIIYILSFTDIKTISNISCCNKTLYNFICNYKWDIIDKLPNCNHINNSKNKELIYIPKYIETYLSYEYIIHFNTIIMYEHKIPDSVIIEHERYINFNYLFLKQKVSTDIVKRYYKKVSVLTLLKNQKIPIDVLYDIVNNEELNSALWSIICSNQKLDFNFIKTFESNIDWRSLSSNKESLCYNTIMCYKNLLIIPDITRIGLSEEVLESIIDIIDPISWINISYFSKISHDFINKYFNQLDKMALLKSQELNQTIIYKIINSIQDNDEMKPLYWLKIAECQKLDYQFIMDNKSILSRDSLLRNRKIKRTIIRDFDNSLINV